MNWSHLIQSPQLSPADPRNHRRVTWMELFFDLIFVGAVAEVGIPLGSDHFAVEFLVAEGANAPKSLQKSR
jgi:low temperature requirement protein LtrA